MYAMYYIYICIFVCLIFVTRLCFMIFYTRKVNNKRVIRNGPAKTMIILGSGGHTAEMIRILRYLHFNNYSPRTYVYADTDETSMEKVKILEGSNTDYKTIKVRRCREIHQSYYMSIFTTLRSTLESIPLYWSERPELLLCNGPGTCVPLCIIAFLFKLLYITKTTIIFVESFCRVKTMSLTGKILYYLTDYQILQWPYLHKPDNDNIIIPALFPTKKKMYDYTIVAKLVPWNLLAENVQNCIPAEMRVHLTAIVTRLKGFFENKMISPTEWTRDSLILVDACLDKTWEVLNSGQWQSVSIEYRHCYSLCSILEAVLLEFDYDNDDQESTENMDLLKAIIEQIDKGILLGAPLPNLSFLLPKIATEINNHTIKSLEFVDIEDLIVDYTKVPNFTTSEFIEVAHYVEPSMETFYKKMFMPKVPAVLEDCIKHWRALRQWRHLNYLIKIAGSRTVPVEIGSRYTDDDWTQKLLNFSEFLQKYVLSKRNRVGYLAQHQLFDQIPELKNDFTIPEYCNFTDNDDDVEQPDVNAWFGPSGTVSPLHFDPKNNFLCQVVGYKRIILYHPDDTPNLYPYDTRLLNNTAQVDPLNPDYEKWPDLKKIKGHVAYLKPGDILYIPPKWWHHVTSLTASFSISFWWN